MMADGAGEALADRFALAAVQLQAQLQFVESLPSVHVDGKLDDLREPTHDIFNGTGVEDNAAYDQRVVNAPDHSASQSMKGAAAGTGCAFDVDLIAGAVANDRHAAAAQVCNDQFALVGRFSAVGIDHLKDELILIEVQARLMFALKSPGPDFCGPGVVKGARPPGVLDAIARGGQACTRFSGVDGFAHGALYQVDSLGCGHFRQV